MRVKVHEILSCSLPAKDGLHQGSVISTVGTGHPGRQVVDAMVIVAHEVTNVGNDRAQLASMAKQANEMLGKEHLEVYADRGYYSGPEILACEESGMVP